VVRNLVVKYTAQTQTRLTGVELDREGSRRKIFVMIVLNNTKCFYIFPKCSQNFSVCMEPVAYLRGGIRPCPLGKIFFLHRKNIGKLGFPPFVWALVPSENMPLFWNRKYAIAWSSAPDPAGKRIVLPRFRSFYLGIELEREKAMRYCGIGRKEEYCEASPVLMDHFNQCLCTRML